MTQDTRAPGSAATGKPPNPMSTEQPWNLVARGYNDHTKDFVAHYSAVGLDQLELGGDMTAVDVACGPGTTSTMLAMRVKHVTAVDFAEQMLIELQRNLELTNLGNIDIHCADGQALPLEDASYDVATSMFGLMFFPDRKKGLSELFRVLRPGGQVLVSSWAPVDMSSLMEALFGALRAVDPSRPKPERDAATLENPELFASELRTAGFEQVRVEPVTHGMDVTDVDEFWKIMVAGSAPVQMLQRRLGSEEWSRQEKSALQYLQDHLGTLPKRLESVAYLGFGRKPT